MSYFNFRLDGIEWLADTLFQEFPCIWKLTLNPWIELNLCQDVVLICRAAWDGELGCCWGGTWRGWREGSCLPRFDVSIRPLTASLLLLKIQPHFLPQSWRGFRVMLYKFPQLGVIIYRRDEVHFLFPERQLLTPSVLSREKHFLNVILLNKFVRSGDGRTDSEHVPNLIFLYFISN